METQTNKSGRKPITQYNSTKKTFPGIGIVLGLILAISITMSSCTGGSDSKNQAAASDKIAEQEASKGKHPESIIPEPDYINDEIENPDCNLPVEDVRQVTDIVIVDDDDTTPRSDASDNNAGNNAATDNEASDITPAPQNQEDEVLSITDIEQKPSFPGGETEMYRWLANNIVYPPTASEEGIQGRVVVEFIVNKNGSISNARVLRSRHPALDREALRVVNAMPVWTPGRHNGRPVRVTYTLPVTFRLQ